jgi:hypothetical protein
MKTIYALLAIALATSAFAQECTQAGVELSEKWVRTEVQREFGENVQIKAFTNSSVSNIYTNHMMCHHETLYTFEAEVAGQIQTFVGRSVMNNEGFRPLPPTLSTASNL